MPSVVGSPASSRTSGLASATLAAVQLGSRSEAQLRGRALFVPPAAEVPSYEPSPAGEEPPPAPLIDLVPRFRGQPDDELLAHICSQPIKSIKPLGGGASIKFKVKFGDGTEAAVKPNQTRITRYLLVNTKCLTPDERTVHRVMLGAGAKLPLGRHDMTCHGEEVDTDQQPGSGSVDLIASAEYMVRRGRYGASLSLIGRYNNANEAEHRLGHGLCAAVEAFRRWDLGTDWKLMPSLGMYHELSGKDALDGNTIEGTGSSTLFTHAGVRVWWRSWGFTSTFQYAVARTLGENMVRTENALSLDLPTTL